VKTNIIPFKIKNLMKDVNYLKELRKEITDSTGIDISKKSKRQASVDLRAIYCRIALDNTNLSDLEIATTIKRSRTMVLYYGNEVFPQVERTNKKVFDIYLCLAEGVSLKDFHKIKHINTKQRLKELEAQLETIKQLNESSVIDLRTYIKNL